MEKQNAANNTNGVVGRTGNRVPRAPRPRDTNPTPISNMFFMFNLFLHNNNILIVYINKQRLCTAINYTQPHVHIIYWLLIINIDNLDNQQHINSKIIS